MEALGLVVYTFRNIRGNERLSIDFHLIDNLAPEIYVIMGGHP